MTAESDVSLQVWFVQPSIIPISPGRPPALSRENQSVIAHDWLETPFYLNGVFSDFDKDTFGNWPALRGTRERTPRPSNPLRRIGCLALCPHTSPHRITAVIDPLKINHGAS